MLLLLRRRRPRTMRNLANDADSMQGPTDDDDDARRRNREQQRSPPLVITLLLVGVVSSSSAAGCGLVYDNTYLEKQASFPFVLSALPVAVFFGLPWRPRLAANTPLPARAPSAPHFGSLVGGGASRIPTLRLV